MQRLVGVLCFVHICQTICYAQVLYECNFDNSTIGTSCLSGVTQGMIVDEKMGNADTQSPTAPLSDVTSSLKTTENGELCSLPYTVNPYTWNMYFCNNGVCKTPNNPASRCRQGKFGHFNFGAPRSVSFTLNTDSGGTNGTGPQCLIYYYYLPTISGTQQNIKVRKQEPGESSEMIDTVTSSPINGWVERRASFSTTNPGYVIYFDLQKTSGIATPTTIIGIDEILIREGSCSDEPTTETTRTSPMTTTIVATTTEPETTTTTTEPETTTTTTEPETTTTTTEPETITTTTELQTTTSTIADTTTVQTTTTTTITTTESTTIAGTTELTTMGATITSTSSTAITSVVTTTSTTTTTATTTNFPLTTATTPSATSIMPTTVITTPKITTQGATDTTTTTITITTVGSIKPSITTATTNSTSKPSLSTTTTNIVGSEVDKGSSDKTLIIALAVGIPVGLILIIGIAVWIKKSAAGGLLSGISQPFTDITDPNEETALELDEMTNENVF